MAKEGGSTRAENENTRKSGKKDTPREEGRQESGQGGRTCNLDKDPGQEGEEDSHSEGGF